MDNEGVKFGVIYGVWSITLTLATLITLFVRYRKQQKNTGLFKKRRENIDLEGVQIGGTTLLEGERVFIIRNGGKAKQLVLVGAQNRLNDGGEGEGQMVVVNRMGEGICGTDLADRDIVVITRQNVEASEIEGKFPECGIRPGRKVGLVFAAGYAVDDTKLIFDEFPTGKDPDSVGTLNLVASQEEVDIDIVRSKGCKDVDITPKPSKVPETSVREDGRGRVEVLVCPIGEEVIAVESLQR
jgi:hypothetical protein